MRTHALAWLPFAAGFAACGGGRTTPVGSASPCFAVYATLLTPAVVAATGLTSLPAALALDSVAAGTRGWEASLPLAWRNVDPVRRAAYWSMQGRGQRRELVLVFVGPLGQIVVPMAPTPHGFAGSAIQMPRERFGQGGGLDVSLVRSSCAGIQRPQAVAAAS